MVYALKIINLRNLTDSIIKASLEEVNVMKKLFHPNIVQFIDVWKSNKSTSK